MRLQTNTLTTCPLKPHHHWIFLAIFPPQRDHARRNHHHTLDRWPEPNIGHADIIGDRNAVPLGNPEHLGHFA